MCCYSPALPCLLLPEAERKTAQQRVKVGSRYIKLRLLGSSGMSPVFSLSSLSAGLCNVLALGTLKEMGWE